MNKQVGTFTGTNGNSEEQYRTLVENMGEGLVQVDNKDIVLFTNNRLCEMLGYQRNELLGKVAYEILIRPEDQYLVRKKNLLRQQGVSDRYEILIRKKNGELLPVEISGAPLRNDEGLVIGSIAIINDISARKKIESALSDNRQRLQALFDNTMDAIFLANDRAEFVDANPAALAFLGYSLEEIKMRTMWDITPVAATDFGHKLWETFMAAGRQEGEYSFVTKKGDIVEVEYRAVANILPGLHLGAMRDITEHKKAERAFGRSEHRFAEFMKNLPCVVCIKDASGRYVYDNPYVEHALNLSPGARIGRMDEDFFSAATAAELRSNDQLVLESHQVFQGIEKVENEDGVQHWLVNKFPIPSENGQTLLAAVGVDVTEWLKAEEEIRNRANQQQAIAELGLRALALDNLELLCNEATNTVAQTLQVDYAMVLKLTPDRSAFLIQSIVGNSTELQKISSSSDTWAEFTLKVFEPVLVNDLTSETRFKGAPILSKQGIVSGMTVIIHGTDEPIGIMGAYATKRRIFSKDDVVFLQSVANVLATSMHRNQIQLQLRESRDQLQHLSHRLIEAQEAERSRLARELHDEVGQVLSAVKMYLETTAARSDTHAAQKQIQNTIAIVNRAVEQVHNLSLDLRPPMLDDLGLVDTLKWYIAWQAKQLPVQINFEISVPEDENRLPREVETTCFRLVQEALTNIAKYANAGNVFIHLARKNSRLNLSIHDDGVGFDLQQALMNTRNGKGLGLLGMKERVHLVGGYLDLRSEKSAGTSIEVSLPI